MVRRQVARGPALDVVQDGFRILQTSGLPRQWLNRDARVGDNAICRFRPPLGCHPGCAVGGMGRSQEVIVTNGETSLGNCGNEHQLKLFAEAHSSTFCLRASSAEASRRASSSFCTSCASAWTASVATHPNRSQALARIVSPLLRFRSDRGRRTGMGCHRMSPSRHQAAVGPGTKRSRYRRPWLRATARDMEIHAALFLSESCGRVAPTACLRRVLVPSAKAHFVLTYFSGCGM